MSDVVRLRGLRVQGRVGVTPEERAKAQDVIVDIDIHADLSKAGTSDYLADTIDYSHVAERIERVVSGGEMRLLEHVAQRIVDEISTMLGVEGVTVEVSKRAPITQDHDRVSVRLERPG